MSATSSTVTLSPTTTFFLFQHTIRRRPQHYRFCLQVVPSGPFSLMQIQTNFRDRPSNICRAPSACTGIGPAWACLKGDVTHSNAILGPGTDPRALYPLSHSGPLQNLITQMTSDHEKASVGDNTTLLFLPVFNSNFSCLYH